MIVDRRISLGTLHPGGSTVEFHLLTGPSGETALAMDVYGPGWPRDGSAVRLRLDPAHVDALHTVARRALVEMDGLLSAARGDGQGGMSASSGTSADRDERVSGVIDRVLHGATPRLLPTCSARRRVPAPRPTDERGSRPESE